MEKNIVPALLALAAGEGTIDDARLIGRLVRDGSPAYLLLVKIANRVSTLYVFD